MTISRAAPFDAYARVATSAAEGEHTGHSSTSSGSSCSGLGVREARAERPGGEPALLSRARWSSAAKAASLLVAALFAAAALVVAASSGRSAATSSLRHRGVQVKDELFDPVTSPPSSRTAGPWMDAEEVPGVGRFGAGADTSAIAGSMATATTAPVSSTALGYYGEPIQANPSDTSYGTSSSSSVSSEDGSSSSSSNFGSSSISGDSRGEFTSSEDAYDESNTDDYTTIEPPESEVSSESQAGVVPDEDTTIEPPESEESSESQAGVVSDEDTTIEPPESEVSSESQAGVVPDEDTTIEPPESEESSESQAGVVPDEDTTIEPPESEVSSESQAGVVPDEDTTIEPPESEVSSESQAGVVPDEDTTIEPPESEVSSESQAGVVPDEDTTIEPQDGYGTSEVDGSSLQTEDDAEESAEEKAEEAFQNRFVSTTYTVTRTNIYQQQGVALGNGTYSGLVTPGWSQEQGTVTAIVVPNSLFCFALMMPHGYEKGLIMHLLLKGESIFACDDYSVFSETRIEISPGPPVPIYAEAMGSMKCAYGGPFHLALNTDVFVKAWRKVFSDGKFLKFGWTVKVDPDCVFLPKLLRQQLKHAHPEDNVYLNNCDQGLHGPIEVLSVGGMQHFRAGIDDCRADSRMKEEIYSWGEDVFLRHCLGFLEINRVDNFHLLSEKACFWEDPVHKGCVSGKVAFHPFKDVDSYFKCLDQAKETAAETTTTTMALQD